MENLLTLIPLLPLGGAFLNGMLALSYSHREKGPREGLVSLIGCAAPLASFVLAVLIFLRMVDLPAGERIFSATLFTWIHSGALELGFTFLIDALSMVMVLVVTGIGTIIHFYSIGYMHGDRGYARYFSYLNLFMFSMLVLVMGENLPLLFVGWEGVGLCSYLLIGFWYEDMEKAAAGKKAFVVNRVGDLGFLLGIFLLFAVTSSIGHPTLDIPLLRDLFEADPEGFRSLATGAGILLFIGAVGKSAQIPLYVWLPDAMAGPTPVSALIHAATMVTAGVYMVARLSFLYTLSPIAMAVVACVGAATALFAATIGICQVDIKKVLAYSTVSQLGYMFVAVGVGAFSAGIFHLMTHAFFKACLFLGAGSVIHAMGGEMNMLRMGALGRKMKITAVTFIAASFAISGVPPFSGFFSKDEILWKAFSSSLGPSWLGGLLWAIGFTAAGITSFYIFRAVILTFYGDRRYGEEIARHVHESPPVMTVPLIILGIGSLVAGLVGMPELFGARNLFHRFVGGATGELGGAGAGHGASAVEASLSEHGAVLHGASHSAEATLMALSVAIGLLGIALAYYLYSKRPGLPGRMAERARRLYRLVYNKYFVDELYERTIVRPGYFLAGKVLFGVFDVAIIDGFVNAVGTSARIAGSIIRLIQTGVVRTYALFMLLGLLYVLYRLVT